MEQTNNNGGGYYLGSQHGSTMVAQLRTQIEKKAAEIARLESQLQTLAATEENGDLIAAIRQQTAVQSGRDLIAERKASLAELERELAAAEAEEARRKAAAVVVKKIAHEVKRWNDSIDTAVSALAALRSLSDEAIALEEGSLVAGVTMLRAPQKITESATGRGWIVGG